MLDIHQIVLLIVAFFMLVTSSLAMAKNSDKDNKNLQGYYIFSIVLSILGAGSVFIGGAPTRTNNF